MIKEKKVDLNINDTSRKHQRVAYYKLNMAVGIGSGVFFAFSGLFLFSIGEDVYIPILSLATTIAFIMAGRYYLYYRNSRDEINRLSEEEKSNTMRPVTFETAEKDIEHLTISKKLIDGHQKNSLILDHKSRNLYYITLNNEYGNETITYKVIPYSEIIQAGITIDENLISKSSLGSKVGGYVVGGMIGGFAGAVVGGTNTKRTSSSKVNKIELRIIINDIDNPNIIFQLNAYEVKNSSKIEEFKNIGAEWESTIDIIINEENKKLDNISNTRSEKLTFKSRIELLKELEELKNTNIVSQDEFNKMKKEIIDNENI